jgi:hypothetical protein
MRAVHFDIRIRDRMSIDRAHDSTQRSSGNNDRKKEEKREDCFHRNPSAFSYAGPNRVRFEGVISGRTGHP